MKYKLINIIACVLFMAQGLWANPFEYIDTYEQTYSISQNQPFQIRIDVTMGKVVIQKGTDSLKVIVSMDYINGKTKKEVNFDDEKNRLSIRLKASSFDNIGNNGEDTPNVTVILPYGVETEFAIKLRAGEMDCSFGGLMMKEIKILQWAGELKVDFDEPNRISMQKADIRLKVGEMDIAQLGNARFERANIDAGIGETQVDFSGLLLEDSKAKVDFNLGEGRIVFPDTVGIRMAIRGGKSILAHKEIDSEFNNEGSYYYTDDFEESKQKLSVLVSPGLGELRVDLK